MVPGDTITSKGLFLKGDWGERNRKGDEERGEHLCGGNPEGKMPGERDSLIKNTGRKTQDTG